MRATTVQDVIYPEELWMRYHRFNEPEKAADAVRTLSSDALQIRPPRTTSSPFGFILAQASLPNVNLFSARATALEVIHPDSNEFYSVSVSRGTPFSVNGDAVGGRGGHLLLPLRAFRLTAEPIDCIVTNVSQSRVADCLRILDDRARQPDRDATIFDCSSSKWAEFTRLVGYIYAEAAHDSRIFAYPTIISELEETLVLLLAETLCREEAQNTSNNPRALRLACEFAAARLAQPISREQLAEIAGVSIRTLSRLFLKRYGMGPMQWIKQQRLLAIRDELQRAAPPITVTDVALRYGFTNPSALAQGYLRSFGELPSVTLRNRH
jgi:AraC-like DNA-binding protein